MTTLRHLLLSALLLLLTPLAPGAVNSVTGLTFEDASNARKPQNIVLQAGYVITRNSAGTALEAVDVATQSELNAVISGLSGYATIPGVQTLTNKTLTSPTINGATIDGGTINGVTLLAADDITVGTTGGDHGITFLNGDGFSASLFPMLLTDDRTFQFPDESGTLLTDQTPLEGLADVAFSSLTLGQGLTWDGDTWVNTTFAASALTDTTNAGNITTGTLAVANGGTGVTTSTGTGSVVLSDSPTFGGTHVTVANASAATNGTQQPSPYLRSTGQGYTTGGGSVTHNWQWQTIPVQYAGTLPIPGGTANLGYYQLTGDINGSMANVRVAYAGYNDYKFDFHGCLWLRPYGGTAIRIGGTPESNTSNIRISGSSGMAMSQNHAIGWVSGFNSEGSLAASINYLGANSLSLGGATATPSTQTWAGQPASGTNITGGPLRLMGGPGTGTGNGGAVQTATSIPGSSGSTIHAGVAVRSHTEAKAKALTSASATAFAQISLQTSKVVGGKLIASVCANDGTDWQCLTSDIIFSAVNKAGTITATVTQTDGSTAASAGTLTVTYTAVQNGNAIDLKANATSSLAASLDIKWSIVSLNSNDSTTVTAQ